MTLQKSPTSDSLGLSSGSLFPSLLALGTLCAACSLRYLCLNLLFLCSKLSHGPLLPLGPSIKWQSPTQSSLRNPRAAPPWPQGSASHKTQCLPSEPALLGSTIWAEAGSRVPRSFPFTAVLSESHPLLPLNLSAPSLPVHPQQRPILPIPLTWPPSSLVPSSPWIPMWPLGLCSELPLPCSQPSMAPHCPQETSKRTLRTEWPRLTPSPPPLTL